MLRYTTDRARPGFVAFYDIRPGNVAGLFLQPWNPHGVPNFVKISSSSFCVILRANNADENTTSLTKEIEFLQKVQSCIRQKLRRTSETWYPPKTAKPAFRSRLQSITKQTIQSIHSGTCNAVADRWLARWTLRRWHVFLLIIIIADNDRPVTSALLQSFSNLDVIVIVAVDIINCARQRLVRLCAGHVGVICEVSTSAWQLGTGTSVGICTEH